MAYAPDLASLTFAHRLTYTLRANWKAVGATGELWFYAPIPIFAVGCTVATMRVR